MSLARDILKAANRLSLTDAPKAQRSVRSRVFRTGTAPVKFRAWTPDEDAAMMRLIEQGLSQSQAGERLGRSREAVGCRLARLAEKGVTPDYSKRKR